MLTAGQNKMTMQKTSPVCTELISGQLKQVRDFLSACLECSDNRLKPFIDYIKQQQGKMLRASVLLLSGQLSGNTNPLHIKIAAVVEMIHAATLLHDDVIDHGSRRRYQSTANDLWGANFAVLLGDYLLSKAFLSASSAQRNDINRILAETAETICRGEMLQNACRGDFGISMNEYLGIIEKKTAVFFANCALLGAVISGADKNTCTKLYDFGLNLGIAYQILDDLIDIISTESETGKTTGRDFGSKTPTIPAIFALSKLSSAGQDELLALFADKNPDISRIIELLNSVKSIDFTKSQIAHYQQQAVAALDRLGSDSAVTALKELTLSATQIPL